MKTQHLTWTQEYLQNCRQMNKSTLTIKNYRADLFKFINWFELTHNATIDKANGNTVTEYKSFLTTGGTVFKKNGTLKICLFFLKKNFLKIWGFLLKKPLNFDQNPRPVMLQKPLSVSSRRRHLSSVKNYFEYLKQVNEDKSGLFLKNPVKTKLHAIKLKDIDVQSTRLLTADDWSKISESVYRLRLKLIVNLLYWGGLRISELANLKTSNFDELNQTITFARKGGYIHVLKVQKARKIFTLFKAFIATKNNSDVYLFAYKENKPPSDRALYNIIMKILTRANCSKGLSPHSFRKACATNLYRKTKDLLLVRDYLNHHDAKITQSYIDIRVDSS
ncbi:MAG: tyrosine-type recombinase/integrase [Bacteriovoracaceae bacterium]|nr:tyrosine-type recombinase/integrase [Bacteriovoracaceae bacterium]